MELVGYNRNRYRPAEIQRSRLRIQTPPRQARDSDELAIGDEVFLSALPGHPLLHHQRIISQKLADPDERRERLVHTAVLNPGNSGDR